MTHGIYSTSHYMELSKLTSVTNVIKINHLDITNYDFNVIFYDATILKFSK